MIEFGPETLDRMVRVVERVRDCLLRSTAALESAGIPYAVAGANAVATWVEKVDPGAVRNTPEVEILLRRSDLQLVSDRFESIELTLRQDPGPVLFQDRTSPSKRAVIRVWFAAELAYPNASIPMPEVTESTKDKTVPYRYLELQSLVKMELSLNKTVNHLILRDLIGVGLIDSTWPAKFPPDLAARLQSILDDPDG